MTTESYCSECDCSICPHILRKLRTAEAGLNIVRTIYKRLVARGGDSLTYGEWAQIGDIVDPIKGLPPVSPTKDR
jgi:hypothetical protein